MRKFMTTFLCFLLLGATIYLKEDPFSKGRYTLYDENHQRTGYIIQDKFYPRKFNIYDENWERRGFIQKDSFGNISKGLYDEDSSLE